ncbi:TetR/AcrR family transcriptional regulator [Paenibacillus arenosi]|uniref:TetR/AcrR family transcriptional regulator n=1 Tax=Paenibacillus arenosi TaxID=2774142 RepID=A0ABR9AW15_9BACL|nr:TetR/AcrR family transcriptional regulator [Paenibacillus arenosi]MBD8498071.1 TetR/AcrR family transcriptional regulator [Paenibacillus arenosi]
MKEKEKWLIEAGMKLFARKGVLATSIQEIATESGISKGAFYLYFDSKEDLLLAIFRYYYDLINTKVHEVGQHITDPKERFIRQLQVQLEEIEKHKEFIVMHAREHAIPFNQDIAEFVFTMRDEMFTFFRNHLIHMFGEERVQSYVTDLTLLMQGMTQVFCEMMLLHNKPSDLGESAAYMVRRIEDLLEGFERSGDKPIFESYSNNSMCLSYAAAPVDPKQQLLQELHTVAKEASHTANDDHLRITLDVLIEELTANEPRLPLVEGMLYNLRNYETLAPIIEKVRNHFCTSSDSSK